MVNQFSGDSPELYYIKLKDNLAYAVAISRSYIKLFSSYIAFRETETQTDTKILYSCIDSNYKVSIR